MYQVVLKRCFGEKEAAFSFALLSKSLFLLLKIKLGTCDF